MSPERHKLITDEAMAATEAAALAAARQMGRGDKDGADRAAVEAMRQAMDAADLSGTIGVPPAIRCAAS